MLQRANAVLDVQRLAQRIGVAGMRVAFLHPRSTGRVLIELVETSPERHPDHGAEGAAVSADRA